MNYESKIRNKAKVESLRWDGMQISSTYASGFQDMRDDAIEIVIEADATIADLLEALEHLVFTAQKLWDDAKPIKDTALVTVTHPIIEEARTAIAKAKAL